MRYETGTKYPVDVSTASKVQTDTDRNCLTKDRYVIGVSIDRDDL